jgi:hypothetical protein
VTCTFLPSYPKHPQCTKWLYRIVPTGKQRAHPTGRIPLSQNLVPCFYAGSDRAGKPDFTKDQAELRAWKSEGRGFFVDHGRAFQMTRTVDLTVDRGASSKTAAVPFSRVQNKLQRPSVANYPIPAVGDHRLSWRYAFMVQPSY